VTVEADVQKVRIADSRKGSQASTQLYALEAEPLVLGLRAGEHTITASHDGQERTWTIALQPGQEARHRFVFSDEEAPASPGSAAAATELDTASGTAGMPPLRIAALASMGLGVVGLAGGTVFLLQGNNKASDADSRFEACNETSQGCAPPQVSEIEGIDKDAAQAKTFSAVSFGAGAGLLILGGVLWFTSGEDDDSAQARVQPWVGPRSAGLSGSF
jgi:hypothetical protein